MMKTFNFKNNRQVFIDDEDEHLLCNGSWYISRRQNYEYISKTVSIDKVKCTIYLHRLILNDFSKDKVIHFLDGNSLNLQKENLMMVSKSVKSHVNNKIKSDSQEKLRRGITERNNSFMVRISVNRQRKYLGTFRNLSDAMQKYDNAAIQLYGFFAQVNFNM